MCYEIKGIYAWLGMLYMPTVMCFQCASVYSAIAIVQTFEQDNNPVYCLAIRHLVCFQLANVTIHALKSGLFS